MSYQVGHHEKHGPFLSPTACCFQNRHVVACAGRLQLRVGINEKLRQPTTPSCPAVEPGDSTPEPARGRTPQLGLSGVNGRRHSVLQLSRAQMPAEERTLPLAASVGPPAGRQPAPAAAEAVVDDDGEEVIDLVDDRPGEHHIECCVAMGLTMIDLVIVTAHKCCPANTTSINEGSGSLCCSDWGNSAGPGLQVFCRL